MSTGFVYFIEEDWTGHIKIGFSEKDPEGRLKNFQTGNSNKLVLLGYMRGSIEDETCLHDEFEDERIRNGNEWFFPSTRLKERINELIEEETFTTYEPYPTDNYFLNKKKDKGAITILKEEDIIASKEQYPTDNYLLNRKKDKLTTYRYSKYMSYNRWQAELIERS